MMLHCFYFRWNCIIIITDDWLLWHFIMKEYFSQFAGFKLKFEVSHRFWQWAQYGFFCATLYMYQQILIIVTLLRSGKTKSATNGLCYDYGVVIDQCIMTPLVCTLIIPFSLWGGYFRQNLQEMCYLPWSIYDAVPWSVLKDASWFLPYSIGGNEWEQWRTWSQAQTYPQWGLT